MSERNHNEILEEQRRARQEFLELKRMQQGEIKPPPKPSEVAIVPKTPAEKLKNVWFHDKWYIIGAAVLVVIIAVLVSQCATRTEYDLEIVAYAYTPLNDGQLEKAAEYLAQYCEDITGDGEVNIQIINCSFYKNGGDTQYQYTMSTKLQAIIAADANALLFITDEESYKYLSNLSEGGSIFEGEPLKLPQGFYDAAQKGETSKLPEGLQISCRSITGKTIEKNKKVKEYYEQSQNILKGLKEN